MNRVTRVTTFLLMFAAGALVARQGETALAQDEQTEPSVVQAQGVGQEQGLSRMKKGSPGLRLRKVDDKPPMTSAQRNKLNLLMEDESKQLKDLRGDRTLSREQKKERYQQIRQATRDKIKSLLSQKEQKNYEESQAKSQAIREALQQRTAPKTGQ